MNDPPGVVGSCCRYIRRQQSRPRAHKKPCVTHRDMRTLQDRGAAKYFHGRKDILAAFMEELELAKASGGGTTFLIQGPPGAGKTALLYKCAEEAEKAKWRAAMIDSRSLYDPVLLAGQLGMAYESRVTETRSGKWVGSVGAVRGEWGSGAARAYAGKTVDDILKEAAGENGLLLVLDEVQTIARYGQGGDVSGDKGAAVEGVMTHIHNGTVGAPVVLLAGGLGTSRAAFGKLDISRFKGRCVVNLGRLSPDAERAVISDWLVIDGSVQEGDALSRWIRAIAAETDGWPQHIMAYVQPAAHLAARAQGQLTDEGLAAVLKQGRQGKARFYRARITDFEKSERVALTGVAVNMGDELERGEIIARLADHGTRGDPDTLFTLAVQKGIFAMNYDGSYAIPIPSMHTWLIREYAPDRELPRRAASERRRQGLSLRRDADSGLEL